MAPPPRARTATPSVLAESMGGVPIVAFAGALRRHPDGWRWRDGRVEPRVFDVTAFEAFAFPRVTRSIDGARREFLSVPREAAQSEPELAQFVAMMASEVRSPDDDPGRVELPYEAWASWSRTQVIGVRWDASDEEELLREAAAQRAQ